jgi:hypothetical protein
MTSGVLIFLQIRVPAQTTGTFDILVIIFANYAFETFQIKISFQSQRFFGHGASGAQFGQEEVAEMFRLPVQLFANRDEVRALSSLSLDFRDLRRLNLEFLRGFD